VHGSFWTPWGYFDAAGNIFDNQLPRLDSFFASHRMLSERLFDVEQTLAAVVRLRPADVRLDALPALRAHVKDVQTAAASAASTAVSPAVVGRHALGRRPGL
jgi:hypothetical protein